MTISQSWEFQRCLSRAQAIPAVGFLLVSPVKALVSLVQLIVGIAGSILFGVLLAITLNPCIFRITMTSLGYSAMGLFDFLYSVSNFVSFGLVAYRVEA